MDEKRILEQKELDKMLERSYSFKIGLMNFHFREPYLVTTDYLADVSIKLEFNEDKLTNDTTKELNRIKKQNSKLLAKFVAVFWLEKAWKIKLFSRLVTAYVYNNIKPGKLLPLIIQLRALENDPAFINSTRLIAQMPRQSEPKASQVEQQV